MSKEKNYTIFENQSLQLFHYDKFFLFFKEMHKKNMLPKKILLSGLSGMGKATFAMHFINYILSFDEKTRYDEKNFRINVLSNVYQLILQNIHPNFYYIKNSEDKKRINIDQIRELISFLNKTSFNKKNKRFILIDGVENLNDSSSNSLLKTLEEPNEDVFFIFIYNSSKKLKNTIKSRCTEFKIFFTNKEKEKILNNLLRIKDYQLDPFIINELKSYYDTPGLIFNYIELLMNLKIDSDKDNLEELLIKIFSLNPNENKKINYESIQNLIELFFYNRLLSAKNKSKVYISYQKTIKLLDEYKRFNLDFDNISYQIKQNILYA